MPRARGCDGPTSLACTAPDLAAPATEAPSSTASRSATGSVRRREAIAARVARCHERLHGPDGALRSSTRHRQHGRHPPPRSQIGVVFAVLVPVATALAVTIAVKAPANISKQAGYNAEGTIAVNPTDPTKVFAGFNNSDTVLQWARSSDSGATWSARRHGNRSTVTGELLRQRRGVGLVRQPLPRQPQRRSQRGPALPQHRRRGELHGPRNDRHRVARPADARRPGRARSGSPGTTAARSRRAGHRSRASATRTSAPSRAAADRPGIERRERRRPVPVRRHRRRSGRHGRRRLPDGHRHLLVHRP